MANFFQELKRRNVLRVAGLYIGIGFMLIEAGSILLPLYGYGNDLFKIWVFIVIAGFPFAVVGSWFFEVTTSGIMTDDEAQELSAKPLLSRRKVDYVIAGLLVVALISSLTLNYASFQHSAPQAPPSALSILISDFNNQTTESLFTGTLEEALQIGVEGAAFISSFPRATALKIARTINPAITALDAEHARLVAVRESVDVVLSGDAKPDGGGFIIYLAAINPSSGETLMEASVSAESKLDILQAISDLATDVREQLGDVSVADDDYIAESLSASNIEAVSAYVSAQAKASERQFQAAIPDYQKAVELDPQLGRAYSGWALAAAELGQSEQSKELWEKTITLLGTMSARERFRTLGLYYAVANQDYDKSVDAYQELVSAFPADTAGYNNLAVSSFFALNFDAARTAGAKALEHFPNSTLYRANYALYAMYAGDLAIAVEDANKVLADSPDFAVAHLPIAIDHVLNADYDAALATYAKMKAMDASRASHATADLYIYTGQFAKAEAELAQGISQDIADNNHFSALNKKLMQAELLAMRGDYAAAEKYIENLKDQLDATQHLVHAAIVLLKAPQPAPMLTTIQQTLEERLQPQPRAYAAGIQARMSQGGLATQVDLYRKGLELADLWWLRIELGKTYLEAGYFTEALSELEIAKRRLMEGALLHLDDMPSLHTIAELPLLLAEVQSNLGMHADANQQRAQFIASQVGPGRAAAVTAARADNANNEASTP